MAFLRFLESIRTPFGDVLMSVLTLFGEETLFITMALAVFWCVDKKRGYYLLLTGFAGLITVQILKMGFRIPRPWILDPNFSIVESAREAATGYSFPSGHTQCATALYGALALSSKKTWMRITGVALFLTVGFSRMYLGVHTLLDVGVSMAIGILFVLLFFRVIAWIYEKPNRMYAVMTGFLVAALGNLLFVELFSFPSDVDATNLADAKKVAWQFVFMIAALYLLWAVDTKKTDFSTEAPWWGQLIKLVGGVGLVLLVRSVLKAPLNSLCGVNLGSGIRYFLIVVVAGVLWPMTFRFYQKKKTKE